MCPSGECRASLTKGEDATMGLRLKFNIVLALVFAAGMAVSAYVANSPPDSRTL